MDLDQQIFIMRRFRSAVKQANRKEMTMPPFIVPKNHTCAQYVWVNNGYFKRRNGDYCEMKDTNEADFMLMECSCCHQPFYLMNTGIDDWDMLPTKEASRQKRKE